MLLLSFIGIRHLFLSLKYISQLSSPCYNSTTFLQSLTLNTTAVFETPVNESRICYLVARLNIKCELLFWEKGSAQPIVFMVKINYITVAFVQYNLFWKPYVSLSLQEVLFVRASCRPLVVNKAAFETTFFIYA